MLVTDTSGDARKVDEDCTGAVGHGTPIVHKKRNEEIEEDGEGGAEGATLFMKRGNK